MRKLATLLLALLVSVPAIAAEPLVLTFDKAQLLRLPVPARRVIIANPNVADVTVEEPTLLAVFGRAVGETSLTVLDADNKEILSRSLVVTGESARHVTVHTPDAAGSREYSCVANRCLKTAAPDASPPAQMPAASSSAPEATHP